jgi:uncharacterized protein RhaS with RHS repeats
LHYNWHRHYDPTIGRYTQPDPLGFVDGPSVYGYALNNPDTEVDPEGLFVRGLIDWLKKNVHFDGPDTGYAVYGRGRIAQVRVKDYFVRLDYDFLRKYNPKCPIYHVNIGSSKPGKINLHIPINPNYWPKGLRGWWNE